MLNEAFVANLPADTNEAIQLICKAFAMWHTQVKPEDRIKRYAEYVDAFSFLLAFCKSRSVAVEEPQLNASDMETSHSRIVLFFDRVRRDAVTRSGESFQQRSTAKYTELLGSSFFYQFSKDDLTRIQVLLNELKNELWKADDLDDRYKTRLRVRLEKLQPELHEQVSDVDQFLGLIAEAGVVSAKLADDAKPIVSRISAILEIVLKAQARAEGIQTRCLTRLIVPLNKRLTQ